MAKKPSKKVGKVSKKLPDKPAYDNTKFSFETPIEKLEECLAESLQELSNLASMQNIEPPDQDNIEKLAYWIGFWDINLSEAKRRGMKTVPTCALENRILGIYKG